MLILKFKLASEIWNFWTVLFIKMESYENMYVKDKLKRP